MTEPRPRKAGEKERALCYTEEGAGIVAFVYVREGCSSVTFERGWTIDPESGWAVWTVIVEATWR